MSRIGFDARTVNDRYHGIGRYAFRLVEAMLRLDPENTYVIYLGRGKDRRFNPQLLSAYPNAEIRNGPWPLHWPGEQAAWPALLRRDRIDLFHSPYITAPLLWDRQKPAVITVHDLIFERYPQMMPTRWLRPYYSRLFRSSRQRAFAAICVSQTTAADLRAVYGPPPPPVEVIYEGVDPGFSPQIEAPVLDLAVRELQLDQPYILNVGARRPHKNLHRLVHAFGQIASELPHQLVFAGPPDTRFPDDARRAAQDLGLDGQVRFLNWVPEEYLSSLYHRADVVVLPSLIEGFGLPALEAMACGTPVIAACTSSYPEVVGEAGLLFEPTRVDEIASALRSVLVDPDRRRLLAEAGVHRARLFTWERSARRIRAVHETLLK